MRREKKNNNVLIEPGVIQEYDYRPKGSDQKAAELSSTMDSARIVQWNIERGYELPAILELLEKSDGDVFLLQELDIGCKRTEEVNVAEDIYIDEFDLTPSEDELRAREQLAKEKKEDKLKKTCYYYCAVGYVVVVLMCIPRCCVCVSDE